jgi:sorting nexin-1/2
LQLRIQSTEARMRFEEIVKLMAQEMERFQEEKTRDLGSILLNFARAQGQLAADTADAWRTLLPELDRMSQAELDALNAAS